MSTVYLSKNLVYHARTKHIHVRFYFVREIFDDGDIKLKNINTKDNLTYMLTKVVIGIKFNHNKNLLRSSQVY